MTRGRVSLPITVVSRRLVLAAVVSAATATASYASSEATLRLHVVLPAGEAVSIAVTDTRDAENRREVGIDGGSMVTVDRLMPGVYDVAVTGAGGTIARGQMAVDAQWVTVAVVRRPVHGGPEARIEVVDRYRIGEGADFGERLLRDLPAADNLWSLIETAAPFVIADRLDAGGLGAGRAALISSRGESWGLTSVAIDGLPVRLPTNTGLLAATPDMNAVAAVGVTSGLAPVEIDTPGVAVNVVSRRPGPAWRGGVDASLTTPGMVGTNALPHAPSFKRVDTWRNVGLFGSGPLTERTGLFVSTGLTHVTHFERDVPPILTSAASTLFAHLVSRPTTRDQVRVVTAVERAEIPFSDRWQFRDADVRKRSLFGRGQITWDRVSDNGARQTIVIGAQRASWAPNVSDTVAGGTMDRVLQGVVPPPPADAIHTQWDGRLEYGAPVRRWKGADHDLRVGLTLRRSTSRSQIVALPTVAESVAGLPARVWFPVAPESTSHRTLREISVFAGDRMVLGPAFTLDLGLRADVVRGTARGGNTGIGWNTLAPRVSFRWSPSFVGVFGGVGRYAGGHGLSFLSFGDPGEATWDVHRWHDGNANQRFDEGEAGALVLRAGRGPRVASLDPNLRVPISTEWTLGAEVRPASHSTLRGALILRRQSHLVGVLNTGVPLSSYRVFYVHDINALEGDPEDDQQLPIYERLPSSFGQDALLLTNPDADGVAHSGIELTYEFVTSRWFMLFGATAYKTVGRGGAIGHSVLENDPLVLGDRYWNPNATKDPDGRLFFDRAYVGKWSTAYRAPGDVLLACTVRYQDGQPFTRMVVAPDLAGGPEVVQAYTMGRTRFTYTATVDVRIEKRFMLGTRRAAVRLDAFNITNHKNELEEDVMTGPMFRLSTIVQPPRTLRLGMRVEF